MESNYLMILRVSHIVVTVLLVSLILIQNRSDSGSSGFLSGGGETFKARKGIEKTIHYVTIFLAIVFTILTIWISKVI